MQLQFPSTVKIIKAKDKKISKKIGMIFLIMLVTKKKETMSLKRMTVIPNITITREFLKFNLNLHLF